MHLEDVKDVEELEDILESMDLDYVDSVLERLHPRLVSKNIHNQNYKLEMKTCSMIH